MRLTGETVVVTGAASGIGRAIFARLHEEGANVVATDVNVAGLHAVARELGADESERILALSLDVTSERDWHAAIEASAVRFNSVTGLVNNAGITRDATMLKMELADFDAVISTHLRASWLGCRAVIPAMKRAGRGAIVNISSSGRHGVFGQTNYSPAKAGIVGLTKSVALEQAKYSIRCNAVAPGAINTPMTAVVPDRVKEDWKSNIALHRLGDPSEIAAAVAFLLSADASFITAQVLDVNGGEAHL